jgi:UDP-N-acetylmuramate--alanine ligase
MNLFLSSDSRPLHFVGIAGAGMSALAMLARRRGVAVTGSDRAPEGAPDLEAWGAVVLQDHDPRRVDGARAVITSAAIARDHPEVLRAQALGIPVVSRKRALAELVEGSTTVAVAGTHGKTTTTVMATEALASAGLDPTGLAGGRVASWGGNTRMGRDDLFVVEADEYDQAFLELHPDVAVVNNVEPEHLECYDGSATKLEDAFERFAGRASTALLGNADAATERLAERLGAAGPGKRVWRFGPGAPDFNVHAARATTVGWDAAVTVPGIGEVALRLAVPGLHNLRNATAALGVVVALGGSVPAALEALARFSGVGRRFERKGEAGGVAVVDDYAHHPTEVTATLAAARQTFPGRRLVVVFQPHLYSRTAALSVPMGAALAAADLSFVTEVYAAREAPIAGVSGAGVAEAGRKAGARSVFVADQGRLLDAVSAEVVPGDVVLTLGAGDITHFGSALLARLDAR